MRIIVASRNAAFGKVKPDTEIGLFCVAMVLVLEGRQWLVDVADIIIVVNDLFLVVDDDANVIVVVIFVVDVIAVIDVTSLSIIVIDVCDVAVAAVVAIIFVIPVIASVS